jgi:hypothetical protein
MALPRVDMNGFLPKQRTAGEYRERAEVCARKAALIKDKTVRAMLFDLADQWTFLANQIERLQAREGRR